MGVNIFLNKNTELIFTTINNNFLKYIWKYIECAFSDSVLYFCKILKIYVYCIFWAKICKYLYIVYDLLFWMYVAHLWGYDTKLTHSQDSDVGETLFHYGNLHSLEKSFEKHLLLHIYQHSLTIFNISILMFGYHEDDLLVPHHTMYGELW